MSLSSTLREELAKTTVSMARFRELVARLLSYGVIVRDEDRTEQRFYDDANKVSSLLCDYFELGGLYLHQNTTMAFFRLYAPGAEIDGVTDSEDRQEPVTSLRARLSSDFVAAALALRFLYQEKLNQGYVDAQGEVLISFEDMAATLQTQLKRPLPTTGGEKLALLKDLKRHRLLRYSASFSIDDEDAYLAIRPTILGVVTNEALAEALAADGVVEQESKPEGADHEA